MAGAVLRQHGAEHRGPLAFDILGRGGGGSGGGGTHGVAPLGNCCSKIETTGGRPCRRSTEINRALSNVSRPREIENRERPNSDQPPRTSSKSADRSQP